MIGVPVGKVLVYGGVSKRAGISWERVRVCAAPPVFHNCCRACGPTAGRGLEGICLGQSQSHRMSKISAGAGAAALIQGGLRDRCALVGKVVVCGGVPQRAGSPGWGRVCARLCVSVFTFREFAWTDG